MRHGQRRGPLTCQHRADVDLADVPCGVSSGIYMVLEMRDGDKSKLRDKGILKAVVNIIDIIAHKLLGMDVWKQTQIDRRPVETFDGTKNELCVFKANFSGNATLAISMTVCRAGAASEVSLYTYISTVTGKPNDRFEIPVPSLNVISGGSHACSCSTRPDFFVVPTGADSVASLTLKSFTR